MKPTAEMPIDGTPGPVPRPEEALWHVLHPQLYRGQTMPTVHTVYLVHHSHTDIGYTHDPPIVWELHTRFLDEALRLACNHMDREDDAAFRWTVEATAVLRHWLDRAAPEEVDRFLALERAGRIEVTAMFANVTPLYDTDELVESLQLVGSLRRTYGITVRHAMNCDVNGQNWPLVDLLLDAGVQGFSMAINTHFGGALRPRPYPFLWEGPSGRHLPTYNGWTYDKGLRFGIGRDPEAFAQVWWPRVQAYLDAIGYPLPVLMLQAYHPFGDNGPAYDFTAFIERWNQEGRAPRLVMATPSIWWKAVERHRDRLPVWSGDWTDFWNFGSISSAREQAIVRASRERLRRADLLHAAVHTLAQKRAQEQDGPRLWAPLAHARHREQAWQALMLWDEHTWGADVSVRSPESEDTVAQWHHKAAHAYQARSLSLLLQRDGLGDLARFVEEADEEAYLLFNPLPWERIVAGFLWPTQAQTRGTPDDTTAGRHHRDRRPLPFPFPWPEEHPETGKAQTVLPPVSVPACGYTVVRGSDLDVGPGAIQVREAEEVHNHRFRIRFDRERGGIRSLYDLALDWEWVDPEAEWPFHGYVHEEVADRSHPWPRHRIAHQEWDAPTPEIPIGWKPDWWARRQGPTRLVAHRAYHTPLGWVVVQELEVPGMDGLLTQWVFLPDYDDFVECLSCWTSGLDTHPQAAYLAFPFHLPGATPCLDVGGVPVVPDRDQLPGACRDYFTVQGWVDFSTQERGITVTMPENPLVQIGGFHFGRYQQGRPTMPPLLLGWVTNNYWETNFRAHQPGRVHARYRLYPHRGPLVEAEAHRRAQESAHSELLLHPLGEPKASPPRLPRTGSLLALPQPPVLVLHVLPHGPGRMLLRLFNPDRAPRRATVASALLRIRRAYRADLFGERLEALEVTDEHLQVELPSRRVTVLSLDVVPP